MGDPGRRGRRETERAPGSAALYSTYIGGTGDDQAAGLAVDAAGNAYVVGTTTNNTWPTTPEPFSTAYNGGTSDGIVAKLDPDRNDPSLFNLRRRQQG